MSSNDPSLSNRDLAPTTPAQRTWGTYNYIALWFSMSMEITTYQLASSPDREGHGLEAGRRHRPARQSHRPGPHAAQRPRRRQIWHSVPRLYSRPVRRARRKSPRHPARHRRLRMVRHSVLDRRHRHPLHARRYLALGCANPGILWACFLGFWLLNMVVVWRGVESIRHLQAFGAPFMFVMAAALLIWVRIKAGSFGSMLSTPSQFHSTGAFLAVFFPSLTAMVGYWATLALNIPDFTRYSKSQTAQAWGQAFGLPVAMTLYTFVGISVTSASAVLFGHPIWNPILLIGAFHQPVVAFVALIAILIATLNVNIGANVVSPSNDFSNLYPRLISFRTGGLITGFLGLAMCPWKLLATPDAYIFGWLVGYSGLLGPVAGIMVADYFFIRKTELDVNSLYHREGAYHYTKGINPRAVLALVPGVVIALIGLVYPPLRFLYDYAWFVGFFTSGILYILSMKLIAPVPYPQPSESKSVTAALPGASEES